ncbi:MAG: hypothetical protein E7164_00670 [Firmicutes bacterium]|nr:hypothetical protein [Bacillota bacterium]
MKNKIWLIVGGIILLIAGGLTWYWLSNSDNPEPGKQTDAQKFAEEYSITEDNVFVYRDAQAIIKIMEQGTGIVYLGFPECPWCKAYVKYLNDFAKEVGIEKIYYYNILNDRKDNTPEYQKMVTILEDFLEQDDEANARIYVPNVSFHIDGTIIGNDLETAYDTGGFEKPEDYWTDDEVAELKVKITKYMNDVLKASSTCTDCNK